jgi:hypothetical protein
MLMLALMTPEKYGNETPQSWLIGQINGRCVEQLGNIFLLQFPMRNKVSTMIGTAPSNLIRSRICV